MLAGVVASIVLGVIIVIFVIVFIVVFTTVSLNCKKCFIPPLPPPFDPCLNKFYQQIQSKLVGVGGIGESDQGISVGISSDGSVFVSGAPYDNSLIGTAYVFVRQNGVYSQFGAKLVGSGYIGTPEQGISVAISGDGSTIAIGGYNDNGIGAVWIFVRSATEYVQQGPKIVASDYIGATAYQGYSVRK
jgi:hypothetical protein